jgi:site-specific DNA-cytosine methylase
LSQHEFTAGFLFCGLGAGARGFVEAASRLGKDEAKFRNLGGIDNDPLSCEDFEKLTGGPSLCADLSKVTPRQLRKAWGKESPDAVFLSPPCKGFSGLLSKKSAEQEKYQALNRLVLQGMFLVCESWKRPPALLVLENVPRITTRGADLLRKVRQLLSGYGYLFHEATHDCGEIGGLAQHRRRYLLVARLPSACGAYVYRPSKKRVRACGEVLGELPLPEQEDAGDLHRLPKLSWLNWVRLALIPAGGDWRDLPGMQPRSRRTSARGRCAGDQRSARAASRISTACAAGSRARRRRHRRHRRPGGRPARRRPPARRGGGPRADRRRARTASRVGPG